MKPLKDLYKGYRFYSCLNVVVEEEYDEQCEKENIYFFYEETKNTGAFNLLDKIDQPIVILLRYDDEYVAYGEFVRTGSGTSESGANIYVVHVKKWNWVSRQCPNGKVGRLPKGVSGKGINVHQIRGGRRDVIKEIDAEWAITKIEEIERIKQGMK